MRAATWKEIKEAFEKAGVKDEDEILYIDIANIDARFLRFVFEEKYRSWTIT